MDVLKRVGFIWGIALLLMMACGVYVVPSALAADDTFIADGLVYKIKSDGTVYVGSGNPNTSALIDTSVKELAIPETVANGDTTYTVTGVSSYAFFRNTTLTSVSFPSTLKRIDSYAFAECGTMTGEKKSAVYSGLSKVAFPSDSQIEIIGSYAFYRCYALQAFVFPKSLKVISEKSFMSCYSFTYFKCEEGSKLETIDSRSFEQELPVHDEAAAEDAVLGKDTDAIIGSSADSYGGVTEVNIPASIKTIGSAVFENQRDLTTVNFESEQIPYLGHYMFAFCTALTSVEIPELVGYNVKPDRKEALGQYTFAWCPELTTFTFGGNVGTTSGRYSGLEMFDKDTKLSTVIYKGKECLPSTNWRPVVDSGTINGTPLVDSSTWDYGYPCSNPTFYYQVTFYGNKGDAIKGENALGKALIRKGVTLSTVTSKLGSSDTDGKVIYSGSIPELPSGADAWAFEVGGALDGLSDSSYAYAVDSADLSFGSVNVPANIFYTGADVKPAVTVSDSRGITLDSSKYTLAFERKQSDGTWNATSDFTSVGTLRVSAASVAGSGFMGATSSVFTINYMPKGTTFVENGIEYMVSKEPGAQGGGEVQVGDGSTMAISRDTAGDLEIPAEVNPGGSKISYKVVSVGDYAFGAKSSEYSCNKLTSVVLPQTVAYIGLYSFANCTALKSINMPSSLDTVNACAFYGCASLTDISFEGESLSSIGASAFNRCTSLKMLVLPAVKVLEGNSFANCVRLKTVVFKGAIGNAPSTQFDACDSISGVLYMKSNWGYDFGDSYMAYKKANAGKVSLVACVTASSSATVPTAVSFDGVNYKVTSVGPKAFSKSKKLTFVTVASKKITNFKNAFKGSKVKTVSVPKTKKAAYKKLLKKKLCGKAVKVK